MRAAEEAQLLERQARHMADAAERAALERQGRHSHSMRNSEQELADFFTSVSSGTGNGLFDFYRCAHFNAAAFRSQ